jgi:CheY-like chemotaxis protein
MMTLERRAKNREKKPDEEISSARVLVVADASTQRVAFQELRHIFEVVTVADYQEALSVYDAIPQFTAVVAEYDLGTGYTALGLLSYLDQKKFTGVRILVSERFGGLDPEQFVNSKIADICIRKPWKVNQIQEAIVSFLASRQKKIRPS